MSTWEERMADRARRRTEIRALMADPENPTTDWRSTGDRPWLNGWPRINNGQTVMIGSEAHCVCCGRGFGVTCVAFGADWEPPGPEPIWPFGEIDCPLRGSH